MVEKIMINKKAQVTIFVILGLILIVVLTLLFLLVKGPGIDIIDENNPQAFIESCTKEAVEESLEILMPQGGDIVPKGSVMYKDIERTYLCYNSNYYLPCTMQRPLLIEHIEDEITNYIEPRVNNCFQTLRTQLGSRYAVILGENMNISTKLQTKQVLINIDRDFKMSRENKIREFDNFKINLIHPIYELAKIAMDISNQEARFCNFDILSYMILYPQYDMDKFRTGKDDIIYTINDRHTNQEFVFAIKSCTLPPGF